MHMGLESVCYPYKPNRRGKAKGGNKMIAKAFSIYIKMSVVIIAVSIVLGVVVGLAQITNGAILIALPVLAIGYLLGKRSK